MSSWEDDRDQQENERIVCRDIFSMCKGPLILVKVVVYGSSKNNHMV